MAYAVVIVVAVVIACRTFREGMSTGKNATSRMQRVLVVVV
jgi:hypothetical protein